MEKDYSSWQKYNVELGSTYFIPDEKGMTKLIAKAKAIEMFSNMIQAIEKEEKKKPEGEAIKFLMSLGSKKRRKRLTIKNQVSLFNVKVEKTKDYIVMFKYNFNLLFPKEADEGITAAIACMEAPFSAAVQGALNMKIKIVNELTS